MHNKALLLSAKSAESSPYPGYYKATLTPGTWTEKYTSYRLDGQDDGGTITTATFTGYAEGKAGKLEPSYGHKTLFAFGGGMGQTAVVASDFYVDPQEMADWMGWESVEDVIRQDLNHVTTGFGGANGFGLDWEGFMASRENFTIYLKPIVYNTNNPVVRVGAFGVNATDLPSYGAENGVVYSYGSNKYDEAVYNNATPLGKLVSLYEVIHDTSFGSIPPEYGEVGTFCKFVDDSNNVVNPFAYYQRFGFTRLDTYKTVMCHNSSFMPSGLFTANDVGKEIEVKVHLTNEAEAVIVNHYPDLFSADKEQAVAGETVTLTTIDKTLGFYPVAVEGIDTGTRYANVIVDPNNGSTFTMPNADVKLVLGSYE